jgi:2,4-dienoyl-CoA reductase-like NADH-dependent reductase (Old Yellow Enzyme family)
VPSPADPTPLLTPFSVRGLSLRNRFVLPGMQRQWCDNGRPLPRLADYYRRRAEGGVGLIITESCAVDHPSSTQTPMYARITDATADAWAVSFKAVRGAGGPMLMAATKEPSERKAVTVLTLSIRF